MDWGDGGFYSYVQFDFSPLSSPPPPPPPNLSTLILPLSNHQAKGVSNKEFGLLWHPTSRFSLSFLLLLHPRTHCMFIDICSLSAYFFSGTRHTPPSLHLVQFLICRRYHVITTHGLHCLSASLFLVLALKNLIQQLTFKSKHLPSPRLRSLSAHYSGFQNQNQNLKLPTSLSTHGLSLI